MLRAGRERIQTYEDMPNAWHAGSLIPLPVFLSANGWNINQARPIPDITKAAGIPLTPRVEHGRWVVDCVNCRAWAMRASDTYLAFICNNCGSPDNQGLWRPVAFPRERVELERILLNRPEKMEVGNVRHMMRNWTPGQETLTGLVETNRKFKWEA